MIRKRIEYELRQHAEAEPVMRRWGWIWMYALRMAVLALIVMGWFWAGDWVSEEERRRMGLPAVMRPMQEKLWQLTPYGVWIPLGVWAWYRVKLARRKAWLELARASGVHEVELNENGILYRAEAAQLFFRWDSFVRIVDRPHVLVLFLNPAAAMLIPKIDWNPEETLQTLAWKKAFAAQDSLMQELHPITPSDIILELQTNRCDVQEAAKLQQRAAAKVSVVVRKWVGIGVSAMFVIAFVSLGVFDLARGRRGLYVYWMMLGVPGFMILVSLWTWASVTLVRWLTWRDVRLTMARPQKIRVTEEGIEVRSRTWLKQYAWPAFNSVELGKQVLMVGIVGGGALIIPRRQIPANETDFLAYLRRRVMNVTQAFPVEMEART